MGFAVSVSDIFLPRMYLSPLVQDSTKKGTIVHLVSSTVPGTGGLLKNYNTE